MKTKNLKNNLWKLYLHEAFAGMFFSVPVIVLFWQNNGLSLTEVMILQSLFAIMAMILEIPTGYFSDIYGRKKTLVMAGICFFLGISTYSVSHNFQQFLIAEAFFALGVALYSGTLSAFVYDTLQDLHQEKCYKKIWGNVLFSGMMALAISNILGGFIAAIDLRYTLYASIPFFALLIPLTLSMHEPKKHKSPTEKGAPKKLQTILKEVLQNKKLQWLIVFSGVIFAFNQSALWLYQPYFKLSGLDVIYFGLVFASFQIMAAFSSKYAHKIEAKIGQKHSLIMLIFLLAGSYFLMSHFVFLFSFSFCFLQQFIRGFKEAVVTDYINALTTSNQRATILSAESFVGRLLYAMLLPLIGWIANLYTLPQTLLLLAGTSLVCGGVILIGLRKVRVI
ncbi:MAG: MFS transporter [Candidatus Gracilibacteria bacterium]